MLTLKCWLSTYLPNITTDLFTYELVLLPETGESVFSTLNQSVTLQHFRF